MTALVQATMDSTVRKASASKSSIPIEKVFFPECSDLFAEISLGQIEENFPSECLVI